MKKYSTILAAIILLNGVEGFSQEETPNSKIFHAFGYTMFLDFGSSPVKVESYWDPNAYGGYNAWGMPVYGANVTNVYEDFGISFLTCFYRLRYNVYEFGDNSAIGLSVTPALGAAYTNWAGAGWFNLPIQAEFEFGAGSTYNSSANRGGYIGGGIEINKLPLFYTDPSEGYSGKFPISLWAQPVVSAGVRYWNKSNKMQEINLKLGFAMGGDRVPPGTTEDVAFPSMTVRLSWIAFINY